MQGIVVIAHIWILLKSFRHSGLMRQSLRQQLCSRNSTPQLLGVLPLLAGKGLKSRVCCEGSRTFGRTPQAYSCQV